MNFVNNTSMTESGLNKKVNRFFFEQNPNIEILKFDYQMGYGGVGVGILFKVL